MKFCSLSLFISASKKNYKNNQIKLNSFSYRTNITIHIPKKGLNANHIPKVVIGSVSFPNSCCGCTKDWDIVFSQQDARTDVENGIIVQCL